MALQAESLVEEWLNKNGFFTIRGIKEKIDEIDLIGIRKRNNEWQYVHCEVQISIRPVTYISKLTNDLMKSLDVSSKNSAKLRQPEHVIESVKAWIEMKYKSKKKQIMRNKIIQVEAWDYWFVHGNVKDKNELKLIENQGVKIISFADVLNDLMYNNTENSFSGSAAGELIEIMNFMKVK